jgi:glycosyltransferase involved in cell wall biosynthesis
VSKIDSTPAVSVIMSIHDGAATVEAAVRSIIRQSFADWELILIDDGSRDDAAQRIARLDDSRIHIVRHGERRGLACRLNEAVGLARGRFIARMDADDICYSDRLKIQVDFLDGNPEIDLVASKTLVFRGAGEIIGVMTPAVSHADIVARPGFVFPHPTWCGKAAWFRENKYDETMPITQDQELLLRTAPHSRFAAIDKILLGYRKDGINLSKSARGRLLFSRALWRQAGKSVGKARAIVQIARQIAIFGADAVAIMLGAEEWLLRRKVVAPLTKEEIVRWQALWRDMGEDNDSGSRAQMGAPSVQPQGSPKRQRS